MSKEQWWPCEWTDNDGVEWLPMVTLTHYHPTVRRAMRDARGVVLEFHDRLGRPNMNLGEIDNIELRCVLLDLAAKWMRGEDGEAEGERDGRRE